MRAGTRWLHRLAWRLRPPVLVLGGGGARGFAHIGVLQVLEEQKVPLKGIVGTSMGAGIGAMYLSYGSLDAVVERWREALQRDLIPVAQALRRNPHAQIQEHPLLQVARKIRDRLVISVALNRSTMLDDRALRMAFQFLVPDVEIAELRLPFLAVTTDLATGEEVRLRSGSLREAVRASCAIPGLLPPVALEGRSLVDGGVVAEVPVKAARELGGPVIAVDVAMDLPPVDDRAIALDTMMRAQVMTARLLREQQLRRVRHLLRPAVGHATWADWSRLDELIAAGRTAALTWLGVQPPSAVVADEADAHA